MNVPLTIPSSLSVRKATTPSKAFSYPDVVAQDCTTSILEAGQFWQPEHSKTPSQNKTKTTFRSQDSY